ncbi:hypothetical protein, partial [Limnohabitans sp. Rim47]|uniref:hypothetical protein n=1 Tax=Limnohabitans sp. Rim47 TaxID=1100721 RepID=UPI00036F7CB2
ENLALLNDIVGAKQFADVDTIAEINELARIANAIQTVAAGGTASPALTVEDLAKIGLDTSKVTTDNLAAVLAAIAGKDNGGGETDSLGELQSILDSVTATVQTAMNDIRDAAQNNTATDNSPSVTLYDLVGVIGVNADNVAAINSALNTTSIDGSKADTPAKVQTIVDAYKAILAEANDADNTAGDGTTDVTPTVDPTPAQYAAIGADIGAAAT